MSTGVNDIAIEGNLDDSPVLGITLLAAANAKVDGRGEDDMA